MQREISRNHTGDWDEQRERLSAFLDGELNEGERAALERHLPTCEQCQRTLDELREARDLLRAMPMPTPPRSFAIPTEGAIPMPLSSAMGGRAGRAARRARGGLWSGVAQAVGGFVAAAGVILVVGSSLIGTGLGTEPRFSSVSNAGSSASAARPATQGRQNQTTSANSTGSRPATPTPAIQDKTVPTPTAGTDESHERNMYGAPVEPENVPAVPIGGGMIVGGAALFVVGRVSRRRRV